MLKFKLKGPRAIIVLLVTVPVVIIITIVLYQLAFQNRVYPNVFASSINLSSLAKNDAVQKLEKGVSVPSEIKLVGTEVYTLNLNKVGFSYDFESTAQKAISVHKDKNFFENIVSSLKAPFEKTDILLEVKFDENKLKEAVNVIANTETNEPVYPKVSLVYGKISVETGKPGTVVDSDTLINLIKNNLAENKTGQVLIPKNTSDPVIDENGVAQLQKRAEKLVDKNIYLTFEYYTYPLTSSDLLNFLAPDGYYEDKIYIHIDTVSKSVDRPAQNPIFEVENSHVKEFAPAKDGAVVDREKLKNLILEDIKNFEAGLSAKADTSSIPIPVAADSPDYQTAEVNDLGIKELLGRGDSTYRGSIASRIHNISHASLQFNGVLVPPGSVFSFNNTVGDISILTGYQQAYIIKDGQTILGDGGGVCQVSTTLFRAVLDAGLPIVERRSHSYRVGYYEQDRKPGFDATVYSPTTDFKFKNDTPAHLLIQTLANPANAYLVFEIYGTSDGRSASTTIPVVYNVSPPPEDLYTDDPTLPAGVVKQIDYAAWGASSKFDYTVTRNSEVIYEKSFYSNYHPWQAKFLRGTGPAI